MSLCFCHSSYSSSSPRRYLRCSTSSDCSFCSRCSNHHHLFVAGRNPRVDLNSIQYRSREYPLSVRTAIPRVVFVVGFRSDFGVVELFKLSGEESFGWCRRSSSSMLVSLKSYSAVFSSKDKFRTPSLREEGALSSCLPSVRYAFLLASTLFLFLESFEGSFVSKRGRRKSEK